MDVKAIAEQVMAAVGEAPEKAQEFIADPKGAIEQLTGHALDEGQIAEVVEHVKSMIAEGGAGLEGLDLGAIGESSVASWARALRSAASSAGYSERRSRGFSACQSTMTTSGFERSTMARASMEAPR